jgi:hypothetical protein
MSGRSALFESDNRSIIVKLQDLINHPSTLDTVREVAINKLNKLLAKTATITPPSRNEAPRPSVNLSSDQLDSIRFAGVPCRSLYKRLGDLQPAPTDIAFLRPSQIILKVRPPFFGLTKQQYATLLMRSLPAVRSMDIKYIDEVEGYQVTIALI